MATDPAPTLVERRLRYLVRQRALQHEAAARDAGVARPLGGGPVTRHGMPQIPTGQRRVPNWPVLDLGDVPEVTLDAWRLEVSGLCEHPLSLTWRDFLALPQVDDESDVHCVTTWSRLDNHWRGVRVRTLAERGDSNTAEPWLDDRYS